MGMNKTDNESPDMPVADEPDMEGDASERPNIIYYNFRQYLNPAPESKPDPEPKPDGGLDDMTLYIRSRLSTRCKKCANKLDESERSVERSMINILVQKGLLSPEEIIDENGRLSIKTKDGSLSVAEFFIRMKF